MIAFSNALVFCWVLNEGAYTWGSFSMDSSSSVGHSVFAIDPGETTGLAWACVAQTELGGLGVFGALKAARKFRGPDGASRYVTAQLGRERSGVGYFDAETQQAKDILLLMEEMDSVTASVTNGRLPGLTAIVIEDFILRQGTQNRNLLSPVRLTAALRVHCAQVFPDVPIVLQQPSGAKSVITDARLQEATLWEPGQQHAMDAVRHLALYLRGGGMSS